MNLSYTFSVDVTQIIELMWNTFSEGQLLESKNFVPNDK